MDKLILLDTALYFNTSFRLEELKQQTKATKASTKMRNSSSTDKSYEVI